MADSSAPAVPQAAAVPDSSGAKTLSLCVFDEPDPELRTKNNVWEIRPRVDYMRPERFYTEWKSAIYEVLADMNKAGVSSYSIPGRAPLTLAMQIGAAIGVGKAVIVGGHAVPGFGHPIGPHPGLEVPMVVYTYVPGPPLELSPREVSRDEVHVLFLGTEQRGGDFSRIGYKGLRIPGVVQSVSAVGLHNDYVYSPETSDDLCIQVRTGIDTALRAIVANHGNGAQELRLYVVTSLATPLSMAAGMFLRKSVRPPCFARVGLIDRVGTEYVFAGDLD